MPATILRSLLRPSVREPYFVSGRKLITRYSCYLSTIRCNRSLYSIARSNFGHRETRERLRGALLGECTACEEVPLNETPKHAPQQSDAETEVDNSSRSEFCVVNFYHLVEVSQPSALIREHREWLSGKNVRGRIYISSQGINAQLSGPQQDAHAYAVWASRQQLFLGLRWTSDPTDGHQFPRLRLKYRENLVQLAGGTRNLPITKEEARATPLTPLEWRSMLQDAKQKILEPCVSTPLSGRVSRPIVLDVRNSYEWDAGHFEGAERPQEEQFNQTPTSDVPPLLRDAPKDSAIMMYCTGGIRCDIYSAHLREKGFQNLYTLQGGVAGYLREVGNADWKGSLFTFDNRLALSPDGTSLQTENLSAAAPCRCCGDTASLPHLNCANIDCNRLFLACPSCQVTFKGCCCSECTDGPRYVRPQKAEGLYGTWHSMAAGGDVERLSKAISLGRGAGRRARRSRRLERLKVKQADIREQKARRREMVKEALAGLRAETTEETKSEEELQSAA